MLSPSDAQLRYSACQLGQCLDARWRLFNKSFYSLSSELYTCWAEEGTCITEQHVQTEEPRASAKRALRPPRKDAAYLAAYYSLRKLCKGGGTTVCIEKQPTACRTIPAERTGLGQGPVGHRCDEFLACTGIARPKLTPDCLKKDLL